MRDEQSMQIIAQLRASDDCDLHTAGSSGRSLFCSATVMSDLEDRHFHTLRFASKELVLMFKGEFDKGCRFRSGVDKRWEDPPRMLSQHFFLLRFSLHGASTWKASKGISPQLHADNLKCTSYDVDTLIAAARYTVSYVKVVGQEASPSKCVFRSPSGAARRRMTAWRNENEGCFWAVKLDVRDLGGHLDVTLRASAGNLSSRVKIATTQVISVRALPIGFQRMLGMVCSKCLLGELMVVRVLPSLSAHSVHFELR